MSFWKYDAPKPFITILNHLLLLWLCMLVIITIIEHKHGIDLISWSFFFPSISSYPFSNCEFYTFIVFFFHSIFIFLHKMHNFYQVNSISNVLYVARWSWLIYQYPVLLYTYYWFFFHTSNCNIDVYESQRHKVQFSMLHSDFSSKLSLLLVIFQNWSIYKLFVI